MSGQDKKILIVTPGFPIPSVGAGEQDRLEGFRQFKRLGYKVKILSKVFPYQDKEVIKKFSKENNFEIDLIPYEFLERTSLIEKLKRFFNPLLWDGASNEYATKNTKEALLKSIHNFKPNVVWFDLVYMWPLYKIAKKEKVFIAMRSQNIEAKHFLDEEGYKIINLIKFIPKIINEVISARCADVVFSITPKEFNFYKKVGSKRVVNLPLRNLPLLVGRGSEVSEGGVLNIVFMGGTYNVSHNRIVLQFILEKIIPKLRSSLNKEFKFHFTGSKLPDEFKKYIAEDVFFAGYVENLDEFLMKMDIALVPSIIGQGMQQKIFEPLSRGIPTITTKRGLATYPFLDGKDVILAESPDEFIDSINKLLDKDLRAQLSHSSVAKSKSLFSQEALDAKVLSGLKHD